MNTTGLVTTVTDELLADLDLSVRAVWHDDDAAVVAVDALTAELRRLRAENAELAKDAGRYRWTLHQAWFQSAFERYDPEDNGTQALFDIECRKITDIAMCK